MSNEVYPQNFFEKDDRKIILTEVVFNRLLALINLSQYKTGVNLSKVQKGYEFGGAIYGHTDEYGNIVFNEVNNATNFTIQDGAFKFGSDANAIDEVINNLLSNSFNCVAHVHTHPYHINSTESGRFFSTPDIEYYKTSFNSAKFSELIGKNVLMLGCLLTASNDFDPKEKNSDDIAFVYYDSKTNGMKYFPNIYVRVNGRLIKLEHNTDYVAVSKETGKVYNSSKVANEDASKYDIYAVERTDLKLK